MKLGKNPIFPASKTRKGALRPFLCSYFKISMKIDVIFNMQIIKYFILQYQNATEKNLFFSKDKVGDSEKIIPRSKSYSISIMQKMKSSSVDFRSAPRFLFVSNGLK
ncbi:hypothetical protein DLM76_19500 [Leptospira yasudae]|uniref:Uncharacterized protein n=1 Tax=Leptospira yasudae TaxID=2202201 RepID=A0ABX9LYV3_9LEPT|nr:hypothetical protein DLM77_18400 [Leptospira yasudae]RHX91019.1 hypothetical protein DLM76_19500 [Leptospira yasudae]